MAYEGYLAVGGVEIVNNERARGYSRTAECPMFWLKDEPCASLEDALATISRIETGETPGSYVASQMTGAPWYDWTQADLSKRFYGVFATSIKGLYDSTRTATVTQGIDAGGTIGAERRTTRDIRATVLLLAHGRDALEFGTRWLDAALSREACGRHGSGCGTTDLTYLTSCPPTRVAKWDYDEATETWNAEPDADYFSRLDEHRRWLHNVAAVSGPTSRSEMNVGEFWALEMEFVITAGRPWVYSSTRPVSLPTTPSTVVDDIPKNLVPYPSAELTGGAVVVARNFSTNPSVETNATGWSYTSATNSGTAISGKLTAGRSTDIAAVGAASYRVLLLGGGSGAGVGEVTIQFDSTITDPDERVSFSVWAAGVVVAGGSIGSVLVEVDWLTAGDALLSTVEVDTGDGDDLGGKVYVLRSQKPPATAAKARVRVVFEQIDWTSASDIRMYTDALAVSVP